MDQPTKDIGNDVQETRTDIPIADHSGIIKINSALDKAQKKSGLKLILMLIIVAALAGAVVYYFLVLSSKNDKEANLPNEDVPKVQDEKTELPKIDREQDTDQDGLPDYLEKIIGTDENKSDTDGDGYDDLAEIKNGYSPLDDKRYTDEEWEKVKWKIKGEDEGFMKKMFSVRDSDTNIKMWPLPETESDGFICGNSAVSDIDNNIYNTVKIGEQCWLKENLKVTKNPAGEAITRYCYDNDANICNTDGGLYDWNTAMNNSVTESAQGICPDGWHVPKDSEWYVLESGLTDEGKKCDANRSGSGCDTAGTKLKSDGNSGFEGILTGYRSSEGVFYFRPEDTSFLSSTKSGIYVPMRNLRLGSSMIRRDTNSKAASFAIRCLKD